MTPTYLTITPSRRLGIMIVTMTATMIVVLDTTIANVALPHMQASLGATPESIAWVLTSYILASAIALPTTGWLSDRIGRRMLFTVATAGFTLSSAICGLAVSLPMMVAARIVQGLCGAYLAPMSQATMYDINPPEKHVQAMTLWGMVIMVGPITGPVLGGWITENFDWRWVFYINVPIGIATAFGAWFLLTDHEAAPRRFDWTGFVLLAFGLASIQLILDRGVQLDWYTSTEIWIETGICVSAFWAFVVHSASAPTPLLPRTLFADRNFVTALLAITVIGGILIAGAALVAPMLQRLLGYPVFQAGLLTAPRGIGTVIGMITAGRLSSRLDARIIIFTGVSLMVVSLWQMTGFSLTMDSRLVLVSGFVQGIGLGLTVLPMNLLSLATLGPALRTEAASLYNLMRSIGGSIAISIMTALLARNVQVVHSSLGADVSVTRAPFLTVGLLERLGLQAQSAMAVIDAEVNRQAAMVAYVDDYWVMMWCAIGVLPMILILKKAKQDGPPPALDAH